MKILQNDEHLQFRQSGRHLGIAIDQKSRNSLKNNKIDWNRWFCILYTHLSIAIHRNSWKSSKFMKILQNDENLVFRRSGRHLTFGKTWKNDQNNMKTIQNEYENDRFIILKQHLFLIWEMFWKYFEMYPTEYENDQFIISKQQFVFILESTESIKIIEICDSFDLGIK